MRPHVFIPLLFLLLAMTSPLALAAIATDATTSAANTNAFASTLTWSHTVGTGDDRILIVGVSLQDNGDAATSILYAGIPLTYLASDEDNGARAELWYLLNPPVGTADIDVQLTGSSRMVGGASSYTGVEQISTFRSAGSNNGGSGTASVIVSSAASDLVVDVVAVENNNAISVGTSQTSRWNTDASGSGSDVTGGGSEEAGASAVTMSWTKAFGDNWAIAAVSMRASTATSGGNGSGGSGNGSSNDASAGYFYDQSSDELRTNGYAPDGAASAKVQFTSAGETHEQCVAITDGATPEFSHTFAPVTDAWAEATFSMVVSFFSDGACATSLDVETYGGDFTWLELQSIVATITALQDQITALDDSVAALNDTFVTYTEDVDANLTAIWAEIASINLEIDGLHTTDDALQAAIDDLDTRVSDLESRMTALEGRVTDLEFTVAQIADWGTFHDQTAEELTLSGSGAPAGANWARITVQTVDHSGDPLGFLFPRVERVAVPVASDGTFSTTFDTSDWPEKGMNIYAQFYTNRNCFGFGCFFGIYTYSGLLDTAYNTWYGMVLPDYGFTDLIADQTFEVWNPQSEFSRAFTFRFTPQYTGFYRISIVTDSSTNAEDVDKTLSSGPGGCMLVGEGQTVQLQKTLEFAPEEGTYDVHLHAERCFSSANMYDSLPFVIQVVDLAKPLPENTAGIDTPDLNQGPSGVYWTNSPFYGFSATMQSTEGWSNALDCVVRYSDGLGGQDVKLWDMTPPDGANVSSCDGMLNVRQITEANEGPFNLEICGEPQFHNPNGLDSICADIDVGYDDAAPVIDVESLNPGVLDIVHSVWVFGGDVADNGEVMTVEFQLINKSDAEQVCVLGYANNTVENHWELEYDTAGECTPDGYYNFTVIATDFAGNTATVMIDPMIDNTAPVIGDMTFPASFLLGKENPLEVAVTDNLAGISGVTMQLVPYYCADPRVTTFAFADYDAETNTVTLMDVDTEATIVFVVDGETGDGEFSYSGVTYQANIWDSEGVELTIPSEEISVFLQGTFDLPMNAPVCAAATDCQNPQQFDYTIDPVALALVAGSCADLNTNTGYCVDGVWQGDMQDAIEAFFMDNDVSLDDGVWFEYRVVATDAADNTAMSSSESEGPQGDGVDLHRGYAIAITGATSPVESGNAIGVSGTLVDSYDGEADMTGQVVDVSGVIASVISGIGWSTSVGAGSEGTQTITATHTSACGDIVIASTGVTVTPAPRGGGGGGGGIAFGECNQGFSRVNGRCVKNAGSNAPAEPEETPAPAQEETNNEEGSGNTDTNNVETPETNAAPPQSSQQEGNLLTGQVTGDGAGNTGWIWLGALVGMIVIGGVAYFFVRKP